MEKGRSLALSFLVGSALVMIPLLAHAGGTITGKVTFSGKPTAPKAFALSKFPNSAYCKKNPKRAAEGETHFLTEVAVAGDGGLKNAIVAVRGVQGKDWLKSDKLKQLCESSPHLMAQACAGVPRTEVIVELCEFVPATGVVVNNGKFSVENHDADPGDPKSVKGVLHSPHGFDVLGARSSTLFNIPLATKGDSLNEKITMRMATEGSVLHLRCDQHEFMQSWFLPVGNPYYAKVKDDGTFEIRNVPAGKHKILAWHPVAGAVEADVEVPEGGTVEANLEIK
jgi:hypothetical protein